jgi:biopolymer transport protein ExbD
MVGSDSMSLVDLPKALADLKSRGVTAILLIPSGAATVQDVVTALEATKEAELENVTVLDRARKGP